MVFNLRNRKLWTPWRTTPDTGSLADIALGVHPQAYPASAPTRFRTKHGRLCAGKLDAVKAAIAQFGAYGRNIDLRSTTATGTLFFTDAPPATNQQTELASITARDGFKATSTSLAGEFDPAVPLVPQGKLQIIVVWPGRARGAFADFTAISNAAQSIEHDANAIPVETRLCNCFCQPGFDDPDVGVSLPLEALNRLSRATTKLDRELRLLDKPVCRARTIHGVIRSGRRNSNQRRLSRRSRHPEQCGGGRSHP